MISRENVLLKRSTYDFQRKCPHKETALMISRENVLLKRSTYDFQRKCPPKEEHL
jgi:hypothetical protein